MRTHLLPHSPAPSRRFTRRRRSGTEPALDSARIKPDMAAIPPPQRPSAERRQSMRKLGFALIAAAMLATILAVLTSQTSPPRANASSHREAPLISEDPSADNTD